MKKSIFTDRAAMLPAIAFTASLVLTSQVRSAPIIWSGAANGSAAADWQNTGNWTGG